jgi:MFS superfamily sulfate permease-like transporter
MDANILSCLFGGFLVVGSLSKTSVAMAAGGRTQLANVVAAILCLLTLVLLTPLFRGMPHPALAAIVIVAMLHLSKLGYLRELLVQSRMELGVAAIVIAGELALGVPEGIAIGVILSLLLLTYRASHPHCAVLGQLPGTEAYRDIKRHPDALTFPGLLIWRGGGDLFFASVGRFDIGLRAALAASHPPAKHVSWSKPVNFADTTACEVDELHEEMKARGIRRFRPRRVRSGATGRDRLVGSATSSNG